MSQVKALTKGSIIDRNNMKEVYQNKSQVYKCLKRLFDVVFSGVALICLRYFYLQQLQFGWRMGDRRFILSKERVKTCGLLKCINFAVCM